MHFDPSDNTRSPQTAPAQHPWRSVPLNPEGAGQWLKRSSIAVTAALVAGLATVAAASSAPLQDFEADFAIEQWPPDSQSELAFTREWHSQGERSLKIGAQLLAAITSMETHDWLAHSTLRFTIHNPSAQTVRVGFELQDQHTTYYERHQDGFGVEPGIHVIDIDLTGPLWRGEQNRPYRGDVVDPIDLSRISRVSFYNHGDEAIYLDDLELLSQSSPPPTGAWAFDFGSPRAPGALGWTRITPDPLSAAGEYGFVEAGARALEQFMTFPTPVLGDGVTWPPAGFSARLEGGAYLGWIAFERGGFWEDQDASYSSATLTCNGAVVHEHDYAPAASSFLFQDVELTDMSQLAERLVWPAHGVARFRFTAVAGSNDFRLAVKEARGVPLRVAALAVAPDTPEGHAWLAELVEGQRQTLRRTFAAVDRGRRESGRTSPASPVVIRRLPVGEMVYPGDWPTVAPGDPAEEILAVAGQRVTVHLAVYAGQPDHLTATASAPTTQEPTGSRKLPPPGVSYGRYLPMRPYGTGAAWLEVNHYRPEPGFDAGPDLARSLLIEYTVPPDAEPGLYEGDVVLSGSGDVLTRWPVRLQVLRVHLPEDTWWQLQESLLAEQGQAGLNCLTGGPGLEYEITQSGQGVTVQGDAAIRYIQLAQRLGTVRVVVPYGGFLPHLRNVTATPEALAVAIRVLEGTHDLPPHYVYAYDEPGTSSELKRTLDYLRRAGNSGLRTIGYTSWHDDNPPWQEMVTASHAPALNLHTGAQLAELGSQGKEPWVYNNGLDRVGMGLRLWRSMQLGAAGRLQWIGLFTQGFAFHNLDGREPSRSCFLVHDRLGVLVTPVWLATREGLLDLRLRLALEQLAPTDDPVLKLWSVDGYKQDEALWPDRRLSDVRRQVLERLAQLSTAH